MRSLLSRIVRALGRGLAWWLTKLGEHPPVSRDCPPGPWLEHTFRSGEQKPRRGRARRSGPRRTLRRSLLLGR